MKKLKKLLKSLNELVKLSSSFSNFPLWSSIVFEDGKTKLLGRQFYLEMNFDFGADTVVNFFQLKKIIDIHDDINFDLKKKYLMAKVDGFKFALPRLNFPLYRENYFSIIGPMVEPSIKIDIDPEEFEKALEFCKIAVSKDKRNFLQYGSIMISKGLFSTDGNCVAFAAVENSISSPYLIKADWMKILLQLGKLKEINYGENEDSSFFIIGFLFDEDIRGKLILPVFPVEFDFSILDFLANLGEDLKISLSKEDLKNFSVMLGGGRSILLRGRKNGIFLESKSPAKGIVMKKLRDGKLQRPILLAFDYLMKLKGNLSIDVINNVAYEKSDNRIFLFRLG